MPFDAEGAKKAGYSDSEIADYLAGQNNFDAASARKSGYSDSEIIGHLSTKSAPSISSKDQSFTDVPGVVQDQQSSAAYAQKNQQELQRQNAINNESFGDKAYGALETLGTVIGSPLSIYDEITGSNISPQPRTAAGRRYTDTLRGVGDAAITMASGSTTGIAGQMVGTVKGIYDDVAGNNPDGKSHAEDTAMKFQRSFTRQPTTETGQRYLQNVGETLEPIAALTPFTQEASIIGNTARAALPEARAAIQQGVQQAKNSVQPAIEAASDIVNTAKNPNSLFKSPLEQEQSKTDFTKSRLESGDTSNDLAGKTIVRGHVVNDPLQRAVINQGIGEGTVRSIAASNDSTRQKLLKMTNISELGSKNDRFKSENRPSDVVGDSLAERVKYVQNVNNIAGKRIDKVAESLKGQSVDAAPAVNGASKLLDDLGVTEDGKGGLVFKNSDIEGLPGLEGAVKRIYTRSKSNASSDAYDLHRLKRYLDQNIDYGKGSNQAVTAQVERAIKDYRRTIDEVLDNNFPEYDKANTQYADTIDALNNFQSAVGSKLDLKGDNVDKALGTRSRGLLSNNQNRVLLMDSMRDLEDISKKYGAKFDDDIITQVNYANALDDHFGSAAATSLRGDIESGAANAGEQLLRGASGQQTAVGIGVEALKAANNKIRGRNKENSYKALKALLSKNKEENK